MPARKQASNATRAARVLLSVPPPTNEQPCGGRYAVANGILPAVLSMQDIMVPATCYMRASHPKRLSRRHSSPSRLLLYLQRHIHSHRQAFTALRQILHARQGYSFRIQYFIHTTKQRPGAYAHCRLLAVSTVRTRQRTLAWYKGDGSAPYAHMSP